MMVLQYQNKDTCVTASVAMLRKMLGYEKELPDFIIPSPTEIAFLINTYNRLFPEHEVYMYVHPALYEAIRNQHIVNSVRSLAEFKLSSSKRESLYMFDYYTAPNNGGHCVVGLPVQTSYTGTDGIRYIIEVVVIRQLALGI